MVDVATIVCLWLAHITAVPLIVITYPVIDLRVSGQVAQSAFEYTLHFSSP
jgi:hypothetical protein